MVLWRLCGDLPDPVLCTVCALSLCSTSDAYNPELAMLSPQQREVLQAVQAGDNVFFTGSAGTGKSFLLKQVRMVLLCVHPVMRSRFLTAWPSQPMFSDHRRPS